MIGFRNMTAIKILLVSCLISNLAVKGSNKPFLPNNDRTTVWDGGQKENNQSSPTKNTKLDAKVDKRSELRSSKDSYKEVNPTTTTSIDHIVVNQQELPTTALAVHHVAKRSAGKCNYKKILFGNSITFSSTRQKYGPRTLVR